MKKLSLATYTPKGQEEPTLEINKDTDGAILISLGQKAKTVTLIPEADFKNILRHLNGRFAQPDMKA